MMKKIWILLGLLALALFVVSCAQKEAAEGEEVVEEKGALAGQATKFCTDSDGGVTYKIKGVVTTNTNPGGTPDECTNEITLKERSCVAKTKLMKSTSLNCKNMVSEGVCKNGACVAAAATPESNCADGLDDDSDAKIDCADSDCLGKANAKGLTCCPGDGACPADTKCDSGSYEGSYQCLGCLADEWDCPAGKECKEGACVAKTCTPGPTGKTTCVKEGGPAYYIYYAVKELQKEDCSTYSDKQWCGYDANNCKEDVGCCQITTVSTACEGNTVINITKNSCTGEETTNKKDCALEKDWEAQKPMVCGEEKDWLGNPQSACKTSCVPGESVFPCGKYGGWKGEYYYYKKVCNPAGDGYVLNSTVKSSTEEICPAGTTCQDKDKNGYGICK